MDDAVIRFAQNMQEKLDKNKHKECDEMNPDSKGRKWEHCDFYWLLYRLREETLELELALRNELDCDWEKVMDEAADVGNYAMMIHDNANRLL